LAKKNAELNNVSVDFFQYDILQNDNFKGKFDLIIANPPYITNAEKIIINRNILDYEPHIALFVGNEKPLVFYEKIVKFAKNNLNSNGQLFLEINQNFGNQTVDLLKNYSFCNIELKKDISGNDRMIKCKN
jgi:release factor glutamine methyltransferase